MKTYRIAYTVSRLSQKLYDNEVVEIYAENASDAQRYAIEFITENRDVESTDNFIVHNTERIADIPKPILRYKNE